LALIEALRELFVALRKLSIAAARVALVIDSRYS
jgi:hypothetical protein